MTALKAIAFYLPQFHPIPENDRNWGRGFTEWTNVTRARPLFEGHHQPHLPGELGFYDLRLPEVLDQQAALAREHGIHGFCFYHYWFNGHLVLERPLHQMLERKAPDMPFCLCWANESWTRRWDGGDTSILLHQDYSEADDREHVRYLLRFFAHPRYIKVEGRPLFLMYRSELHPNIRRASEIWREEAVKAGFPGLFLARVENFKALLDPADFGFDAGVEFAPKLFPGVKKFSKRHPVRHVLRKLAHKLGFSSPYFTHRIYSMRDVADVMSRLPDPGYLRFRCVAPTWDNTARRKSGGYIFVESEPELFETWTRAMAQYTRERIPAASPFLFVNAWNEWAEGCHLEPCQRWGRAYLEAFARGLSAAGLDPEMSSSAAATISVPPQKETPGLSGGG